MTTVLTRTECAVEACDRQAYARGWCRPHYDDLLPPVPACIVEGCEGRRYARQVCVMHYSRLLGKGDPGSPGRLIAERGQGHITCYGYRVLDRPDHPLATHRAQGKIEEHRVVLYDAIGPGPHPCHWCGRTLVWVGDGERLNVDHLDDDRLNNIPANLVPSCRTCNTTRGRR